MRVNAPEAKSRSYRWVGYQTNILPTAVADHFLWKSMVAPDMLQEQPGNSCRVQGGDCGDGMNLLGQAIHHHEDGIVSLGVQEFSDHVYRDHLPASIRDLVGDQLPHLLCREGLHLVACITSCDELGNIPGQPWPPVVLQHQFQHLHLPSSRVSCNSSSVVCMHQVMTESRVVQDVNTGQCLLHMSTHQSGVPLCLRPSRLSPWDCHTECSVRSVP